MTTRTASCRCGQLRASATGEPARVSVCHCLDCKKRSGSSFAVQGRWPKERVQIEGQSKSWSRLGDGGNCATFHFCPDCGSEVHYSVEGELGHLVAIPLGAFDDPFFGSIAYSVYEERKHHWVAIIGDEVEHFD